MHARELDIDGLRLHLLEAGTPSAEPPVLLLHGWPTNAQLWRHALPAIGEHRHALALDLPGFGRSSKPLQASYSFRFYDRVLTGVLDALGADRVGLVVHDLGGPLGLHWAVGHRERVSDLVLLNTLVFSDVSWAVKAFVALSYLPIARDVLVSPWGIRQALRLGVRDRARLTPEVLSHYLEPYVERPARQALTQLSRSVSLRLSSRHPRAAP